MKNLFPLIFAIFALTSCSFFYPKSGFYFKESRNLNDKDLEFIYKTILDDYIMNPLTLVGGEDSTPYRIIVQEESEKVKKNDFFFIDSSRVKFDFSLNFLPNYKSEISISILSSQGKNKAYSDVLKNNNSILQFTDVYLVDSFFFVRVSEYTLAENSIKIPGVSYQDGIAKRQKTYMLKKCQSGYISFLKSYEYIGYFQVYRVVNQDMITGKIEKTIIDSCMQQPYYVLTRNEFDTCP